MLRISNIFAETNIILKEFIFDYRLNAMFTGKKKFSTSLDQAVRFNELILFLYQKCKGRIFVPN